MDQSATDSTPDSLLLLLSSTGCTRPHSPKEWIDKYAGAFDEGWDILREKIFEKQLNKGIIPEGTALTPRPDEIPSWDSYPDRYKPVATRLMEVFAGFLAHTDAQIKRILDYIKDVGCDENTLIIYITGDNGAWLRTHSCYHPNTRIYEDLNGCLNISKTSEQTDAKIISMLVGHGP